MCLSKIATVLFMTFCVSLLHKINAAPMSRSLIRETLVQVPYGETVTLMCASNDENHSFFYWYINEKNVIIGPTNEYDNAKFRYEVLSGNLTVRAVSKDEEGVYNCVSRGVTKDDVNIRSVRMKVQADWEEVLEENPDVLTNFASVMENYVSYSIRRKPTPKSASLRTKNTKLLSGYSPFQTDLCTLELELENSNLRKTISLLEGKNKVLEEHCNLLKEKNKYYQTRLEDLEQSGDKEVKLRVVTSQETEQTDKDADQNTSLKDRISGVLFGVALPKLGNVMAKIREKRKELNIDKGSGGGHCVKHFKHFKKNFETVKLNLVRVAIALSSLLLISGVIYGGYRIWKTRYSHPSYLIPSDDDDDSGEEIFSAPGASRSTDTIVKTNSTDSFETPGISTDFKSILDRANK